MAAVVGSAEDKTSPWLGYGHAVNATVDTDGGMGLLVGIAAISVLLSCGELLAGENVGRPLMDVEGGSIPSKAAEGMKMVEASICHRNTYWWLLGHFLAIYIQFNE